jgi:chlorite dismutase
MNRPAAPDQEASQDTEAGWHCSHLFYSFDRQILKSLSADEVRSGRDAVIAALDPAADDSPIRLQTSIVSGHKADFGLMVMDPDPLKIDAVHQKLLATPLGPALKPTYSFVSITEISEYVPSVEQYGERLVREGEQPGSPAYDAKIRAYESRLPAMNRQRLTPEFPDYPATCFYPMNKSRVVGANWFMLPFTARNSLMAEHARSGMQFAGKVSQLITVGVGLEDWEWGVTLWGRTPQFLKDIVYRMRFDEASAKYAEFGPFYTSYISSPAAMLDHCRTA